MSKRIEFQVSEELFERVERARGLVPRSPWVVQAVEAYLDRALESALSGSSQEPQVPKALPASTRTSGRPSVRDTWAR